MGSCGDGDGGMGSCGWGWRDGDGVNFGDDARMGSCGWSSPDNRDDANSTRLRICERTFIVTEHSFPVPKE